MSEKEEFEKFILYGVEREIYFKKCIKNEMLLILPFCYFFVIEIISERRDYVFLTLCLLPALFHLISAVKLKKEDRIVGIYYILYNGIVAGCFSFLFGLIGFEILIHLFSGKEQIIMLCIASAGYIFVIILLSYILRQLIKKRKYSMQKGGTETVFLCVLSGACGGIVAKIFLKDADNGTAIGIVCMLSFFLSYLSLIGIVNILKYQYIVRHSKILNVTDSIISNK